MILLSRLVIARKEEAKDMECHKCGKAIGTRDVLAYQVRAGYADEDDDFLPDQELGYYCGDCLAEGV